MIALESLDTRTYRETLPTAATVPGTVTLPDITRLDSVIAKSLGNIDDIVL
jgi:hypothetical protein